MKWRKSPPELISLFKETLDAFPQADQRKMFGYACSFVDDKMFTGLHQENWVVRLSEKDRAELAATYSASSFEPMPGRTMKEYLILPAAILESRELLHSWIEKSMRYAQSVKK